MFTKYEWREDQFLNKLSKDSSRKIVCSYLELPQALEYGSSVEDLKILKEVKTALLRLGIKRLFAHQEKALELIKRGINTFIMSGTGTGKTEAFLIPILDDIVKNPFEGLRTILIYPTKALARDQLKRINKLVAPFFGIRALVYDGDTPLKVRKEIYFNPPPILITNPDMIHVSLQVSEGFRSIVRKAKYIVLDDAHVYNGVFGTHVSYVLRRLRRFIEHTPIYIATSATIDNPKEFIEELTDSEFEVVSSSAGKRSEVIHTFVKPLGRSKILEVLSLARACQEAGLKCLIFADSHRVVEMIKLMGKKYKVDVEVHRAGLRPEERAEIEEKLRSGEIMTVAATPTLELGIDIGDLDVIVLYSIPPTFTRYVQRTGRSGRRGQKAYVFVVLGEDPISSYYERHPEDFFNVRYDPLSIDKSNEEICKVHILAMARDKPFKLDELKSFEKKVASELLARGLLRMRGKFVRLTKRGLSYLKTRMSLRGVGEVVKIYTENGVLVGEREMPMALKELHPGAIYVHRGNMYLSLALTKGRAIVRRLPSDLGYITVPVYYSIPQQIRIIEVHKALNLQIQYINLELVEVVYGYVVKTFPESTTVREELLDKGCEYRFKTKGLLVSFPVISEWNEYQNAEAFHAIEHALITASQTLVGASHTDLGGVSFPSGHIYIYDSYPGGSGVSKLLMKRFERALVRAYKILSECTCKDGCPRCIYSPYCGNNNKTLSRVRAKYVLEKVLRGEIKEICEERWGRPIV